MKKSHNNSSVKFVSIVFISISAIILLLSIFLFVFSPGDLIELDLESKIYGGLPIAYKLFLYFLFRKTFVFGSVLIFISILFIVFSFNLLKHKNWARNSIQIFIFIIGLIIVIFWINFLFFIFNVNSVVPNLNLSGIKLTIYQIVGFIISLLHLVFIYPLYKMIHILMKKEVKSLFN